MFSESQKRTLQHCRPTTFCEEWYMLNPSTFLIIPMQRVCSGFPPFIIPSLSSLSQSHSAGSTSRRGRALLRPRINCSPVPFENGSTRLQTDRRPREIGTTQPAVPETDGAGPEGAEKSEIAGRLTPHSLWRQEENLNSSLKLPPITSSAGIHNLIYNFTNINSLLAIHRKYYHMTKMCHCHNVWYSST